MTPISRMTLKEVEAEIVVMALAGQAVLAAQEWRARRFCPSSEERQSCYAGTRAPSLAFPYSLWSHVHTAAHVAMRFGVTGAQIVCAARLLDRRYAVSSKADGTAEMGTRRSAFVH